MEEHIPIRPDRSLVFGRKTSKWSLWDVVFHENDSKEWVYILTHTKLDNKEANKQLFKSKMQ